MTQQVDGTIPSNPDMLEMAIDRLNAEFDTVTEKPYTNSTIFLSQLRGVLERYGIQLPAEANREFMDLGAELSYILGDSDKYLYIIYDTNDDGSVDGYAQVVDSDDLADLMALDDDEIFGDREEVKKPWVPPARKDDDSGNTDEY
jgi:hypothetical protein